MKLVKNSGHKSGQNVKIFFDDDVLDSLLEKRTRLDILKPNIKCIRGVMPIFLACVCQE